MLIRPLKALMNWRASPMDVPLMAADIIDADAWLIEHPWPPIAMSVMTLLSSTSTKTITSSPQRGLKPSVRTAGGVSSSPWFRGER